MWKHRWNALFFLGSKITADVATKLGRLLLERKAMTNLDSILKSTGITLPTKFHIFKAMVFPVVMYGCELDHKKGWVLKNWLWTVVSETTFERVPWTARRSNQSILKEINPEHSLEGLMLKLKLPYFTHLMRRADSLEKTLMLGKTEGRRGQERMKWMASPTQWTRVWANSGDSKTGKRGVLQSEGSWRFRHDWVNNKIYEMNKFPEN